MWDYKIQEDFRQQPKQAGVKDEINEISVKTKKMPSQRGDVCLTRYELSFLSEIFQCDELLRKLVCFQYGPVVGNVHW